MKSAKQSDATVPGPSGPAARGLKILCALLITGLLLAGLASLGVSFVPFSVLLARVRSVSNSGQGTFFRPDFYHAMQTRLRLIGIANLAAGIILLGLRRQMCKWTRRVFTDARILARDFCLAARSLPVTDRLALAGLIFFAAALRIPLLSQPMRYDEAITYLEYSSRPFYVALSFYNTPNNHVFHTLLVRLAYLALGNHPWALRLPVLLAGLCLVPATYAAARSLYRNSGALLAAALVASSSMLIEYSSNARGYEVVCLLFIVMIPAAAYALRCRNWAAWLLLAIVSALGFYTIPIMLYPFGGLALWLLLSIAVGDSQQDAQAEDATQEDAQGDGPPGARPDSKGTSPSAARSALAGLFAAIVLTMLLAAELYSPVLAVSGWKALFANKWVSPSPFPVFFHQLPASLASTWWGWNRDLPAWLAAVLAAGFMISLLWHRRIGSQRVPLPLALLLCVAPLLFVQRVIPFERVWLFALPLYFICTAAGWDLALEPVFHRLHLRHAMALLALVVALFAGLRVERSGSVYLSPIYLNNESRGMPALAAWLKGQLGSGDTIVAVLPSDGPLRYYMQRDGVPTSYLTSSPASSILASSILASSIGGSDAAPRRRLVVVNESSRDTVEQVCEAAGQPHQANWNAKLLVQFESAKLYEVPFAP